MRQAKDNNLNTLMDELDTVLLKHKDMEHSDVESFVISVNTKTGEALLSGFGCRGCMVEYILQNLNRLKHDDGRPVEFRVIYASQADEKSAGEFLKGMKES